VPVKIYNDCLPDYLYQEILSTNREYSRAGDYSPSLLNTPVQITCLKERHDVEAPASDHLWALYGTSLHAQLAKYDRMNSIKEESFVMTLPNGKVLSTRPDMYQGDSETLRDYKLTSIWTFIYGGRDEWGWQGNIGRVLVEHLGFPVKKITFDLMFRDWSKRAKMTTPNYPNPCESLDIPIKDDEVVWRYIENRIALLEDNRERTDEALTPCTKEERWEKPTVYAVKKKGNKRAMPGGLHETEDSLDAFITSKGLDRNTVDVEVRKGEATRCEMYCAVEGVCHQRRIEAQLRG